MKAIPIMQYILYGLELLACIAGFIYWKKIKNSYWKWFPVYLAIIVAAEMIGNYLNIIGSKEAIGLKLRIFNYAVIPIEFLFLHWLYIKNSMSRKNYWLVISCMVFYALSFFADQIFFYGKQYFFSSFSYCIGNLALLICIISFYVQLATSDNIINFKRDMMFWISLGLLIFYLGTLPFFAFFWEIYHNHKSTYTAYIYVLLICNWIMYSMFVISFVWGKPKSI